jgi:small subunit ribosomal protein S16
MAVTIRMARYGRKKKPFYRIVAADRRFSRDGRYLEIVGTYDPASKATNVKKEVAKKWINTGAVLSPTVKNIFAKQGISLVSEKGVKTAKAS